MDIKSGLGYAVAIAGIGVLATLQWSCSEPRENKGRGVVATAPTYEFRSGNIEGVGPGGALWELKGDSVSLVGCVVVDLFRSTNSGVGMSYVKDGELFGEGIEFFPHGVFSDGRMVANNGEIVVIRDGSAQVIGNATDREFVEFRAPAGLASNDDWNSVDWR